MMIVEVRVHPGFQVLFFLLSKRVASCFGLFLFYENSYGFKFSFNGVDTASMLLKGVVTSSDSLLIELSRLWILL